ncbi:MAG: hypothetical protein K9J83_03065 [Desulfarculaceae bacterium]|nr:hypothetical protein [Desulfarculaceae bacterium]
MRPDAKKAGDVAREMDEKGCRLKAVRLDSRDMVDLSRRERSSFDKECLQNRKISILSWDVSGLPHSRQGIIEGLREKVGNTAMHCVTL